MPAVHVPGVCELMRVLPMQRGAGGCVQLTPWHGSGLQLPLEQPKGHVVSCCVYVQPAMPQVPGEVYERRTLPTHTACGGVRQPWQTSLMHRPPLQPKEHIMSCGA